MNNSEFIRHRHTPEIAWNRAKMFFQNYQEQCADRYWERLPNAESLQLPDQRYNLVSDFTIPAEIEQLVIARCTQQGKESLLSLPYENYYGFHGVEDFQIQEKTQLDAFLRVMESVAQGRKLLLDRAQGVRNRVNRILEPPPTFE